MCRHRCTHVCVYIVTLSVHVHCNVHVHVHTTNVAMAVCVLSQEPPSPDASVRSIPSTPSEFTFNSRSPAESLRYCVGPCVCLCTFYCHFIVHDIINEPQLPWPQRAVYHTGLDESYPVCRTHFCQCQASSVALG